MSSSISGQIGDIISSENYMESCNVLNGKSKKSSSFSNNIDMHSSLESTILITAFKNLTSLIRSILKIIITPENFKKYEIIEDYYEENVSKEIINDIEDIANEYNKLKDKEELRRLKKLESIGLNTDINFEYITLSETMKEVKEFQQKNNELLSQIFNFQKTIADLKNEINFLNNFIKENINNSLKNTSDIISEEIYFNNGFQNKSKKNFNMNKNNSSLYIGQSNELPHLVTSCSSNFINRFRQHKKLLNSPFSLTNKYKFNESEKTFNNSNIYNNKKSKVKFKIKNNSNKRNKSEINKTSEENNKSCF